MIITLTLIYFAVGAIIAAIGATIEEDPIVVAMWAGVWPFIACMGLSVLALALAMVIIMSPFYLVYRLVQRKKKKDKQ